MTAALPLVLVPGLLCDAELWAHQRQHLADIAGMTVADTLQDDSITDMARRLLENAPPRFALAGLSMGGYIALEAVRQAPERIARLALVDTSARLDRPELAARRRGLIELAQKGKFRGVTPRLLPMLIHPGRLQDTALVETITRMAENTGRDAFIRQQTAILNRPDARTRLAAIRAETIVICGRQDAITPQEVAEEMAAGIPGAHLHILGDCGHLAPLERPELVTSLFRTWLTSG